MFNIPEAIGYELGILFRFSFHILVLEFIYIFMSLIVFQINGPLFIIAILAFVDFQTVLTDSATLTILPGMVVQTLRVWINIAMFWLSSSLLSANNQHTCMAGTPCTSQELRTRFGPVLATMVSIVALYFTNIACLSLFRSIHNFGVLVTQCIFEICSLLQSSVSDDCVEPEEEFHPASSESEPSPAPIVQNN